MVQRRHRSGAACNDSRVPFQRTAERLARAVLYPMGAGGLRVGIRRFIQGRVDRSLHPQTASGCLAARCGRFLPVMKQVLAAVDFSDFTAAVVAHAAALAEAFGANLTLLHVAAPDPDFVGFAAGPDTVRVDRARRLREEHRQLQETADALRRRGLKVKALLVEGPTAEKILEQAESLSAELLVIGSRGRGALARALLGSVSEAVLHGAEMPVSIVKSRGKRSD